jgi:two-component system, cell cycle response regulator
MTVTLIERIKSIENLPSLPTVALEVLEVSKRKDVSTIELASAIEKDPALTAKILRLANSSLFGMSRQISDLRRAMITVGIRSIKMTVLGFSLVEVRASKTKENFDYINYWRRSWITADAARLIAEKVDSATADISFICGLLCDISILAGWQWIPDAYKEVLIRRNNHQESFQTAEEKCLGMSHETLSRELLDFWSLPPEVCEAIGQHHQELEIVKPDSNRHHTIANITKAAAILADLLCGEIDPSQSDLYKQNICKHLPLNSSILEEICSTLDIHLHNAAALFSVDTEKRHYTEIQMEANIRLARLCSMRQTTPETEKVSASACE